MVSQVQQFAKKRNKMTWRKTEWSILQSILTHFPCQTWAGNTCTRLWLQHYMCFAFPRTFDHGCLTWTGLVFLAQPLLYGPSFFANPTTETATRENNSDMVQGSINAQTCMLICCPWIAFQSTLCVSPPSFFHLPPLSIYLFHIKRFHCLTFDSLHLVSKDWIISSWVNARQSTN